MLNLILYQKHFEPSHVELSITKSTITITVNVEADYCKVCNGLHIDVHDNQHKQDVSTNIFLRALSLRLHRQHR